MNNAVADRKRAKEFRPIDCNRAVSFIAASPEKSKQASADQKRRNFATECYNATGIEQLLCRHRLCYGVVRRDLFSNLEIAWIIKLAELLVTKILKALCSWRKDGVP